ncbi:MAG: hypothetical protein HYS41_00475 [Candidatus Omnitrophica bacterium]|nr:hypothetical protein [Candidatus Omnitrophota bacterium]
MPFRLDTPFYPIPGPQPEAAFGAVLEILLKTRLKLHLESDRAGSDEDVNAYLAGLLVSYIDPRYLTAVSQVLSRHEVDVFHAVCGARENYQVYWIYKVNADDELVHLGVFDSRWQNEQARLHRMKRYYTFASDYQRRIYGKPTAVGEIEQKLSDQSERYLAILTGARNDYLHMAKTLGGQELLEIEEGLARFEQELPRRTKMDEFLDAYAKWLSGEKSPEARTRILSLAEELKGLDPSFPKERLPGL